CPLNACCSKWGFCGTTAGFCDVVPGPPGNGCVMSKSIGYVASWSLNEPCSAKDFMFTVDDINVNSCDTLKLWQFSALRGRRSRVKLIISVGGWSFNDPGPTQTRFSDMASTQESRARFIASVEQFLLQYNLDGIDLDWEYPSAPDRGGQPKDAQNYVYLVKELREKLRPPLSISIASPASQWYLKGFLIQEMSDYIVFMTYDMHGNWDYRNKWVGPYLNAHNNWTEINDAITMIGKAGVTSNKILLGIGFYGRSFKLADRNCFSPGCRFQDPDNVASGKRNGERKDFVITITQTKTQGLNLIYDRSAMSKLLTYNGGQDWVGYDDEESISDKLTAAADLCMGGLAVWSIDQDDQNGALHRFIKLGGVLDSDGSEEALEDEEIGGRNDINGIEFDSLHLPVDFDKGSLDLDAFLNSLSDKVISK
ncbi:glycoside hydrolase superfamily, partial [Chytridium lagenaria]